MSRTAALRPVLAYSVEAADAIRVVAASLSYTLDDARPLALQSDLANGWGMSAVRHFFAYSDAAASGIDAPYAQDLGTPAGSGDIATYEAMLADGHSWAHVRRAIILSPQAVAALPTLGGNAFGTPATAGEITGLQHELEAGASLMNLRSQSAGSSLATDAIDFALQEVSVHDADAGTLSNAQAELVAGQSLGSVLDQVFAAQLGSGDAAPTVQVIAGYYQGLLGRSVDRVGLAYYEAQIGSGMTLAGVRFDLAKSPEARGAIGAVYEDVLGRAGDAGGLDYYQGMTEAHVWSLSNVRRDLASSPEAAGVVTSFYQVTFGRPPSADELVGMQFALGSTVPDNAVLGYYDAKNNQLALTSAGNLLAQLPVAVTLCGGGTPQLSLPYGVTVDFANATQLAACVLGVTLRQGQASAGSLSAYQLTVNWLDQIDQKMLQVASYWLGIAQYDHSIGNEGQSTLAATAYQLALKLAALPPGARGDANFGMAASVQVNGHSTTVIVYADTSSPAGHVEFHDKPTDPSALIETVVTIVVDVVASVDLDDLLWATRGGFEWPRNCDVRLVTPSKDIKDGLIHAYNAHFQ